MPICSLSAPIKRTLLWGAIPPIFEISSLMHISLEDLGFIGTHLVSKNKKCADRFSPYATKGPQSPWFIEPVAQRWTGESGDSASFSLAFYHRFPHLSRAFLKKQNLDFCVVKRYDPKSLKIIKIWLYMRLEALERSRRRSEKASKRGAALKPPASP
mgnify:CR=1 FL=1